VPFAAETEPALIRFRDSILGIRTWREKNQSRQLTKRAINHRCCLILPMELLAGIRHASCNIGKCRCYQFPCRVAARDLLDNRVLNRAP